MSVNKAIIVGNLCADPEQKDAGSTTICKLRVATNRTWTSKDGEKQEEAEFHRVTVFGKSGEACAKYLTKGRQVYVEGRLKTTKYEKDGQDHYGTEIVADRVDFLGGKGEGGSEAPSTKPSDDGIPF